MFSQFLIINGRGDVIISRECMCFSSKRFTPLTNTLTRLDRKELSSKTATIFFSYILACQSGEKPREPVFVRLSVFCYLLTPTPTHTSSHVQHVDGIQFVYLLQHGLYYVITSLSNISPSLGFEFLARVRLLISDFCGGTEGEAMVRSNFVLVYELLDEILDSGVPQDTDTDKLTQFVFEKSSVAYKYEVLGGISSDLGLKSQMSKLASVVPDSVLESLDNLGRSDTMKSSQARRPLAIDRKLYSGSGSSSKTMAALGKNEIFADLLEKVDVTYNARGEITLCHVSGELLLKSYLLGRARIQIGLSKDLVVATMQDNEGNAPVLRHVGPNTVVLDDLVFHDAVDLSTFEQDRVIHMYPPLGEFAALKYRCSTHVNVPFRVGVEVDTSQKPGYGGEERVDVILTVYSDFSPNSTGKDVRVVLPVPVYTSSVSMETFQDAKNQRTTFVDAHRIVVWHLGDIRGQSAFRLRVKLHVSRSSAKHVSQNITDDMGPVSMHFEVPNFKASGMTVEAFHIFNTDKSDRWIRYLCRSQSHQTLM